MSFEAYFGRVNYGELKKVIPPPLFSSSQNQVICSFHCTVDWIGASLAKIARWEFCNERPFKCNLAVEVTNNTEWDFNIHSISANKIIERIYIRETPKAQ